MSLKLSVFVYSLLCVLFMFEFIFSHPRYAHWTECTGHLFIPYVLTDQWALSPKHIYSDTSAKVLLSEGINAQSIAGFLTCRCCAGANF